MSSYFLGLMSGTSMDGVDAVLADMGAVRPKVMAAHHHVMPAALRHCLLHIAHGESAPIATYAEADVLVGRLFAETALELLNRAHVSPSTVRAIGSHGQTVFHNPNDATPTTLQIGDPNIIAEITGITTVADFRRRDIAAGGQGAPLVPAFHHAVFHDPAHNRAVLNLGGMANITWLPRDPAASVTGFDTGPGNVLMDMWTQEVMQTPFDPEGTWAASGQILPKLLASMAKDAYFDLPPPKSTGREYFHRAWLQRHVEAVHLGELTPELAADVQATLCELTALTVAQALHRWTHDVAELIVCGGGTRNVQLILRLQALAGIRVINSSSLGVDPLHVEALAFAWLAKRTLENQSGNLPSVTGAKRPVVLGGIYPSSKEKH